MESAFVTCETTFASSLHGDEQTTVEVTMTREGVAELGGAVVQVASPSGEVHPGLLGGLLERVAAPSCAAELDVGVGSVLGLSAGSVDGLDSGWAAMALVPGELFPGVAHPGVAAAAESAAAAAAGPSMDVGSEPQVPIITVLLLSSAEMAAASQLSPLSPLLARGAALDYYPYPPWNPSLSSPPPLQAADAAAALDQALADAPDMGGSGALVVPSLRVVLDEVDASVTVRVPDSAADVLRSAVAQLGMTQGVVLSGSVELEAHRHLAVGAGLFVSPAALIAVEEGGLEDLGTLCGASWVAFVPGAAADALRVVADGVVVDLSLGSWMVLRSVLGTGDAFKIQSDVIGESDDNHSIVDGIFTELETLVVDHVAS